MAKAQVDDEFDLFGGFLAEIEGYLPVIAANLRRLLTAPDDEALLEESHRFAHTIKSSAAMMGYPDLRRIAAPMEGLLARAYAGEVAVDDALTAVVESTLTRIREFLSLQQSGGNAALLLAANDHAYATFRPSAPREQRSGSEDAQDRLVHLGSVSPEELALVLDTPTVAGEPQHLSDVDAVIQAAWWPAETSAQIHEGAAQDGDAPGAASGEGMTPESPDEPPGDAGLHAEGESLPVAPRLTVLPGGAATPSARGPNDGQPSIAAEWLAEILGGQQTGTTPELAPEADDLLGDAFPQEPEVSAAAIAALEQEWQTRLQVERQRLIAQHAQERAELRLQLEQATRAHADDLQRLDDAQSSALRAAAAEREQALEEQRAQLEQQVQRYLEDELRPQLEEEIREELAHEFELAALLDPPASEPHPAARPPTPSAGQDAALAAEMREIFAQEAAEHIEAITEHALMLRDSPDDDERLRALRRSVHTLKGAAATVGFLAASALCHQIESVLDQRLDGGAALSDDPQTLRLVLEGCNVLDGMVRDDASAGEEGRRLAERLSAITGVAQPAPAPPALGPGAGAPSPIPVAAHAPERADPPPAVDPATSQAGSAGLALRVSLTVLDRLLSSNHELIITESTFEQRLQRLRQNLTDLRRAGDRLREAGIRLEAGRGFAALLTGAVTLEYGEAMGASAQPPVPAVAPVAAGSSWQEVLQQRAHRLVGGAEFDALELDRYTEYHRLTREVAEAALDVSTSTADLDNLLDDLRVVLKQQERLHVQQNEALLSARMGPVQSLTSRLARAVQSVAGAEDKQIVFTVEGEDTLLDRAVLEDVGDALLHLVRNAADHGIESPSARVAAGKPAPGAIRLRARREGPEVVLSLADDGRGLDNAAILKAAMARGFISDASALAPGDVQQLIFTPGLSTAAAITDISGRGVGLDVVRANIQALRGDVTMESVVGRGTTFTLRVPASLSLLAVALVEVAGDTYAIPLTLVRHVEKVIARRIQASEDGQVVRHGGRVYRVVELAALLGRAARPADRPAATARRSVLFVHHAQSTVALAVDRMLGKREVVVKDLGAHLRRLRGVFGATMLGNGDLALILDVPTLLEAGKPRQAQPTTAPTARRQRQALVVDDSPSVRRLTCAVFERQGWHTRQARDGVDAVDLLRDWRPDAVVMDIEMPRMDGFELLSILKRQPETADMPAIMVTSRSGEKHREKAARLGVDAYLVKPFREDELFATVERLVSQEAPQPSLTAPAST